MSEIFEFFKSEAIDGDIIIRSEAMTKLRLIGALMGPERVRNELIPFLKSKYVSNIKYFTFYSVVYIFCFT